MIEVQDLTKRYGGATAVDGLTFSLPAGQVTGFLGPNGAGKSTTLRVVLGLDAPTAGRATVHGRPYRDLAWPLREVGAVVDAAAVHDGHTAHRHLLGLARSHRLPAGRVGEVLGAVGLTDVADDRRVGGFSLGMRQRLGIAAALLGDPGVLVLDEPMNGLDTDGIRWIRALLRRLADEGRTVLLSSHLMSEMELVADHLVVVGRGRLVADTPMRRLIEDHSRTETLVRAAATDHDRTRLGALLADLDGGAVAATPVDPDGWLVTGPDAATLGRLAHDHDIALRELTPRYSTLEDVYTAMTTTTVQHRGTT